MSAKERDFHSASRRPPNGGTSTLLSIAGFDPSSGAGITADLMVFAAHGFFGTSCVTALTVQSTLGVRSVVPVAASVLADTLVCLHEDMPPAGVKIGMLATAENVHVVADYLLKLRSEGLAIPVVLDPVLRSSSGRDLLSADGLAIVRSRLLPLVDWVTPNLTELGALTGLTVKCAGEMEMGADALHEANPKLGIVVTGGHLQAGADDLVVDCSGGRTWLKGERIQSNATHGTGCAFSSSMLCGLGNGLDGERAAKKAKRYVAGAIRQALGLGRGRGPLRLLWALEESGPTLKA